MEKIEIRDMDEWREFVGDNEEALVDAYGSVDQAFRHAINGGLTLGGGAAPLFEIYFAE